MLKIIINHYYSFYNNGFLYRFGDYIYGLYMLDFEMSMFNINYKKNRLDNNILHIYGSVD
jgi:hypothetical protein